MPELQAGSLIHPTAVVARSASIAAGVQIGPYCVVGPQVSIAAGCVLGAHVVLDGRTSLGEDNRVYAFAAIGLPPQDKKYAGENTALEIGRGNTLREYVTINTGTVQDGGVTRIGNDNWIMAYVHIAHDCQIASHTTLANNTTLAGHVQLDEHVTLGGATLVHQFCHIGAHAFSAYGARINTDVPPFIPVSEGRARPRGLNIEGLKRRGFSEARLRILKEAYRLLYRSDLPLDKALDALAGVDDAEGDIDYLCRFLANSGRSIVR
jgi:UDP-N-acetylglucosamine acyltransferase